MIQKFPRIWDNKKKISFLQRKILINSILYYELNDSKLSDREFDELAKQLVEMQTQFGIVETDYEYAFIEFDGTTGFDLYGKLTEKDKSYLNNIARHICKIGKVLEEPKKNQKGKLF